MASLQYTGVQRGGGKGEPLRSPRDVAGAESSDSDASSDAEGRGRLCRQKVQAWACLSVAGVCLLLFVCRYVVLGIADQGGSRGGSGDADVDFGEKVMIVSQPSTAPATLAGQSAGAPGGSSSQGLEAALGNGTQGLAPPEDLTDGNVCEDDEELLDGLCYRKCSLLTGGQDAIRTSPWTCCEKRPCAFDQKLSIHAQVACTGFAVAGDGSCPHKPGACLKDEELYLGICYKKCSLLTEDEYPYRVAPATCCQDSGLSCLDFRKDYTSEEFNVGGGEASPGACLEDEELLLGQCYKRCSILTGNEYPLRLTAATCCKAHSRLPHHVDGVWHLGCLDPRKDKTSSAYNTLGDQHGDVANAGAHYPLKNLTEAVGDVHV